MHLWADGYIFKENMKLGDYKVILVSFKEQEEKWGIIPKNKMSSGTQSLLRNFLTVGICFSDFWKVEEILLHQSLASCVSELYEG